jgi:membrane-associated phospholipid phosphatase
MIMKPIINSVLISISLLVFIQTSSVAQNMDINLLRSINVNRNTHLDGPFKFVSKTATPVSLGVPLTFAAIGLINNDKNQLKFALNTGISISTSMLVSTILKYSINRTRPYKKYPDIQALSSDFTPSFPSGHTTSAFSTATTLSLMYPKWYVIVPSFAWASSVAYSRMHMGMHYPFDILGGIVVGVGTSCLSYWLLRKFN